MKCLPHIGYLFSFCLRTRTHATFRHCHYFQEVIELCDGDEIAIAQCAYGGGGDWNEQLHIENKYVEFDTRIGHLAFVVLYRQDCNPA
jgi:hypothetical protein